ncbi:PucR family transcriptional regulator [Actinomadura algeriensis]|nr:helix-turn-helix domain-containing protein [Actinomadura algeriensis]
MHNRLIQSHTDAEAAEIMELMRQEIPPTVAEAVREIEDKFPQYRRIINPEHADFLAETVLRSINGFMEIVLDKDTPLTDVLEFFRRTGEIETLEGLSPEISQAAFRLGAAIAIRRLTAAAERHPKVDANIIAQVAAAVMDYLNRIAEAVSEGHRTAPAVAVESRRAILSQLVEALLDPSCPAGRVKELADECGWRLPDEVAVIALKVPDAGRWPTLSLPPEVLHGLHLSTACLVVPDPDGPGRHRAVEIGLRKWRAAVGPTVPLGEASRSLAHARHALVLMEQGVLPPNSLVRVTDHLPMMILTSDHFLTDQLISRRLRPLIASKPGKQTRRLAETFVAALDHSFVATDIALAQDVHPQTVRYRLRKLEALFGPGIYDPDSRLEFHMALRAWLATSSEE